jgi:hypothetical protein
LQTVVVRPGGLKKIMTYRTNARRWWEEGGIGVVVER